MSKTKLEITVFCRAISRKEKKEKQGKSAYNKPLILSSPFINLFVSYSISSGYKRETANL